MTGWKGPMDCTSIHVHRARQPNRFLDNGDQGETTNNCYGEYQGNKTLPTGKKADKNRHGQRYGYRRIPDHGHGHHDHISPWGTDPL